jgi:hypothetical protein
MNKYDQLAKWYKWVTWFGIFLNSLFIFPLLFAPVWTLSLLGLSVDPSIFGRIPGMLLLWISVFYIPASLNGANLKKYRVYAWLAMFPSRIGGASFFFGAVFLFGYAKGFLPIAIVDLSILLMQLTIMMKIRKVEHPPSSVSPAPRKSTTWMVVLAVILILVVVVGVTAWYKLFREVDQHFESNEEFFKYGSIGAENAEGLPYWIWIVLPRMFPEYLPGPGGYNAVGLYNEPGHDIPVGFSKKTIGYERIGVNCALCHSATIRMSPGEAPVLYVAGASGTMDVLAYQRFLFKCASDPRFTGKNVLKQIAQIYKLSFLDRLLYQYALVPGTKKALLKTKELFAWTNSRPDWGRGRIDPFNPVKVKVLKVDIGDTIGNSDMMPIWNLKPRQGMALHWDGLNTHLIEVVRSSSIGDGATPKVIPLQQLQVLQDWLMDLKPPKYPSDRFPINSQLASAGEAVFTRECASCHAFGGARTGQVMPAAEVGTDPHRVAIWTKEAADAYNQYASKYPWKFDNFRSTGGYVCVPLDAIWTRGPYLHNGSVPTLRDLLEPVENRPKLFYRGYNVFEPKGVGFVSQGEDAERIGFRYDISVAGNSNQGHLWGTQLPAKDKDALVEYMKTL